MKQQAALIGILSCAALLVVEGEAFTASPSLRQTTTSTKNSLNLVPNQGKQLVTAYNARCSSSEISSQSQESAAAAYVVYYPMVGFRFFEGFDNVFQTTSHVSCAIPTKRQKEEEVYGWFSSQSCKLDLLSEDVCYNPNVSSSSDDASSLP